MKETSEYKYPTQSRIIKFRVWNSFYGEFTYYPNSKIFIGLDGNLYDRANDLYDDNVILQQYIGLTDINNIEIYEGDIVSGYFSTVIGDNIPFKYEFSGVIEYIDTEFKCKYADFPLCKYKLTVIGNCFQCSEQYEFHKETKNQHD